MVSAIVLTIGSVIVMVALFPIVLLLTMVLSDDDQEERSLEEPK